ncbi:MAG: hypothetical protein AAF787_22000 [Chloroflexota bacterium]
MRDLRRIFLNQVAAWDTPTRTGLVIALMMMVGMVGIYAFGPDVLRVPAVMGIAALVTSVQLLILWGNRRMVTPFTKAQRLYLNGKVDEAIAVLEAVRTDGKTDVQDLTLLGNLYRQRGDLAISETVLTEALAISPDFHFPLYGMGKTKLNNGEYAEAVLFIARALENDAPPVVAYDLMEAHYRAGDVNAALAVELDEKDAEPYRVLMAAMIRGETPPSEIIEAGLPYWEQAAERFAHTPYGTDVAADLRTITELSH